MPDIKSGDQYFAAQKQDLILRKTASRTAIAQGWFSVFDVAGEPGAGVLAGTNTAAGVVPTDAIAGYPPINAFGASAIGRLTRVDFSSSVACRLRVYDRLFVAGAYAFNANTTLAGQPSYASRINLRNPANDTDANDYKNLELWAEMVTAATGNQSVAVTYTDQDGNTGATTGAIGIGAAQTVGRCWQLPLASGDSGVQQITNVTGSIATVGTFNVMVLRPLCSMRIPVAGAGATWDAFLTGMKQIFADSSLFCMVCPDSTATGVFDLELQIANA